jgi:hypothetical protein
VGDLETRRLGEWLKKDDGNGNRRRRNARLGEGEMGRMVEEGRGKREEGKEGLEEE